MPPSKLTVRPAEPSDAGAIVAALHRAEGTSHFERWLYHPSQVARALQEGTIRSWVAVDHTGSVRAHAALVAPAKGPGLHQDSQPMPSLEFGLAFTDPGFRGRGLAQQIGAQALGWAATHQVDQLFSWTTTLRPFAQRGVRDAGATEVCLLLAMMPPGINRGYRHDIDEAAAAMLFVLRLRDPSYRPTWVVPAADADITAQLVAPLGVSVTAAESNQPPWPIHPADAATAEPPLSWRYFEPLKFGVIDVADTAGPTALAAIVRRTIALAQLGADVTYVDVPGTHPGLAWFMSNLAGHGFTYAGVHPNYDTGHLRLRMQAVTCRLQAKDTVATASELGRRLLDHVWAGLPDAPAELSPAREPAPAATPTPEQ